ncbi:MAG: hypothetical protein BroJett030_31820 [Alphaproteobacteria bacterium]|nr:MAG: hypothetical protein BroJett030_31820 [Alphaproteobacteria bacterium]
MSYVSGFSAAVPQANRKTYVDYARVAADYFRANGALRVVECWEEDVPDGKVTSFPMAVKRQNGEAILFSWIEWPDRATAHACFEKMGKEPLFDPATNPMPFDGQRMIWGGFEMVLDV